MALRLIELVVPAAAADTVDDVLQRLEIQDAGRHELSDERLLVRLLLDTGQTETVSDALSQRLGGEQFRMVLLPVEATLPSPEETEKAPEATAETNDEAADDKNRISREELYQDVTEAARWNRTYVLTVVLSSIVAAIGLLRDDVAIIIGAMVIAPLLGPNVALALGVTLGDVKLALRALAIGSAGVAIAAVTSGLTGMLLKVDPLVPAISARTHPSLADVLLGLAAGAAGALAFTTGVSAALIGVMVAVALLPPLVTAGLLLGNAAWGDAGSAAMLFLVNVVCINLAAVLTFRLSGISPRRWWEKRSAQRTAYWAIAIWAAILVVLSILLWSFW